MKRDSLGFNEVGVRDVISYRMAEVECSHLEPSISVPDQALTIAELLDRHRQGYLTDLDLRGYTEEGDDSDYDDLDLEAFSKMDKTDQAMLARSIVKDARDAEQLIAAAKKAADDAEALKKAEDKAQGVKPEQ